MLNIAARAMDTGIRFVVVLAGLRDDLRTQTAQRFVGDLLQRGDRVTGTTESYTHPQGKGYHGARKDCWAPRYDQDVNHDEAFIYLCASNLQQGKCVLAVAKKNIATLNRLAEAMTFASREVGAGNLPLLILDDECDEASVSGDSEAPTPDRIAELWKDIPQYVAYIGLTATPAANLLQETSSTLYPKDFVLNLKAPGDRDTSVTYFEPSFERRYTGGHVFYRYLEDHQRDNFLVRTQMSGDEFAGMSDRYDELEEALVAYFIAGAIRLFLASTDSLEDPANLPEPHTMMAHTESRVESHWALCERVVSITRRNAGKSGDVRENLKKVAPIARIESSDLMVWFSSEQGRWKRWYDEFLRSRQELGQVVPDRLTKRFPTWEETQAALPSIFTAVQLRVVNSDDKSSDKPLQFQATYTDEGVETPTDVYSIIIGGNRLSRGLTIEGLCISYYTKSSLTFAEDTTTQRERWFGYRGRYLEFCRLFTHRALAIRLRCFYDNEQDLRKQLAWNIDNGRPPIDATYRFLTTKDSLPTAKLGRGRPPAQVDVSGAKVFVGRVQMGGDEAELAAAEANQGHAAVLAEWIIDAGEQMLSARKELLGYVLRDVSAVDLVAALEGFRYTFHNPDPTRGVAWNVREYYRAPAPGIALTSASLSPSSDPFLVAAYLKFWKSAFEDSSKGEPGSRLRASDGLSEWKPVPEPRFNLAVRAGSLYPVAGSPFGLMLLDREVDPDGLVGSRWGGRGYGSPGDEWIDLEPPGNDAEAPRAVGECGLFLLHVIGRNARGREKRGYEYIFDRPCAGLVIPAGGPCMRYVLAEG